MVRLQKFLADAGVASRRAAEQIILEGRVRVNGKFVRLLGTKVDPDRDEVILEGKIIRARKKLYIALNKPPGCVCSHNDELGRPTIYDLLPKEWQIVHSVGRLDFNSEGLIFLTNDGQFALRLTHPRYGVRKKYIATVEGKVEPAMLAEFTRGIFHGGEKLKAQKALLMGSSRAKSVVELELAEGRSRVVRRTCAVLGLGIRTLSRVAYGPVLLGDLSPGASRSLTARERAALYATVDLQAPDDA